jgi:hypothetical protein
MSGSIISGDFMLFSAPQLPLLWRAPASRGSQGR